MRGFQLPLACPAVAARWRVRRWPEPARCLPGLSPVQQTWSRWCSFRGWTRGISRTAFYSGRTLAAAAPARCSPSAVCSSGISRSPCPEERNTDEKKADTDADAILPVEPVSYIHLTELGIEQEGHWRRGRGDAFVLQKFSFCSSHSVFFRLILSFAFITLKDTFCSTPILCKKTDTRKYERKLVFLKTTY